MAGDWVKMRGILLKHPKVGAMAKILAASNRFIHWLTPLSGSADKDAYTYVTPECVTRVTVASLLAFWSAANQLASDEIVRHADRHTCDDLAGVPDFGEALIAVGWIVEDATNNCLILPDFQEFNIEVKQRSAGAERTARYRERKRLQPSQQASQPTSLETSHVTPRRKERKEGSNATVTPLNLPEGISPEDWKAFRESRQKLRKPMTGKAEQLAVAKLHEMARQGYDASKLLNLAIESGWLTFFPRDDCRRGSGPTAPGTTKLDPCPCGAPATMKVGGKPRCAAHARGFEAAA